MGQIIGLIIALIIAKLVVDTVRDKLGNKQAGRKNGEVIDISDSWLDTGSLPYQKKAQLMNPKEIAFYHSLAEALNDSDYVIAPHVHMPELIAVADNPRQQEYLQRLRERNIDLVILEACTFRPVLIINFIEEDIGRRQQLSNSFTAKAVKAADLPQLEINPGAPPAGRELLAMLRKQGLNL